MTDAPAEPPTAPPAEPTAPPVEPPGPPAEPPGSPTGPPGPPAADSADAFDELPEQMQVRQDKRRRLLADGMDPYPSSFRRTARFGEILATHQDLQPDEESGRQVTVAGRVIFVRNAGKLCFARLREGDGSELQIMLSYERAGSDRLGAWKSLVDIGDLVGVDGEVVRSRRGELSVTATDWRMLAKAIRPLPVAHRALADETRVRQRYLDLIMNADARAMVQARSDVLASIRATLASHAFVEVETPILQAIHGGAAARPFSTYVNALEREFSLRIALELHLKRLVVGGIERVYEIGRTFRNEGIDATHAPEFSMLEAYQAYGDCRSIAEITRELVVNAAQAVGRTVVSDGAGGETDLTAPWPWRPLEELVSEHIGTGVGLDSPAAELRDIAARFEVEIRPGATSAEILVELYEKLVEPTIRRPTYVCDFPAEIRPLARVRADDPRYSDGADVVVGGVELVTLYSELADPVEQRAKLVAQAANAGVDPTSMQLDEDYLRALEYGLPPTGGMGLGIDRLLRLLMSQPSLRQTVTFPLLRPE